MFLILINFGNQYLGIIDQWLGHLISNLLLELRNNDIDDQLLLEPEPEQNAYVFLGVL